jgi:ABC-type sugar transport system substrate-binding protein
MDRRSLLQGMAGVAALGALPRFTQAAEKTIVYLTPGLDLPFWRYLAKGIENTAKEQGYGFIALDSHNNAQTS